MLDGGVLGGQAKGIEADRVQHVKAAHAGLTGHGIADGIVARVAHVQVADGYGNISSTYFLGLLSSVSTAKRLESSQAFIHLDSMACAS